MANNLTEEVGGLNHFATDGESYGHHHRKGEMGLAYCIKSLLARGDTRLTNYGEYLARHPSVWEAQIVEKVHGVVHTALVDGRRIAAA